MKRFSVSDSFEADAVVSEENCAGEIYHVVRNSAGGKLLTPIARYFAWKPQFAEGFNSHWRVDCFVSQHHLSPDPTCLGNLLVLALMREQICTKPIWMSAHSSDELDGKVYGDVFSDD